MSHAFCRSLLKETMKEVCQHTTPEQRKAAWAWKDGVALVEFHGPDKFYWFGSGCCLYHAKAQGWYAWMQSIRPGSHR